MAILNETTPVTLNWTLAGEPGSVESVTSMEVMPPEAGVLETDESGAVSYTASIEATGVIIKATGDNIQGDKVGALVIESAPFDNTSAPDVLTADGGSVVVG
jgi:hypothetical protein